MIRLRPAIIAISATLVLAVPTMAQDQNSSQRGAMVQADTTIVFAPAGTNNIDAGRLRTWGEFAETHPKIAKALAYNSSLIDDRVYLSKHPELDAFFQAHPDIKEAMTQNPGNFVAIEPRPGE
jgi:hypothetical protein